VLLTLALVAIAAFLPGRVELAARVYALLVCGLALLIAVAALRRGYPRAAPLRPKRRHKAERPEPPPTLARIEQETALGIAGSFELHHRLRPRVRNLARSLLAARRGISLENDPELSRELLGEAAWELVRDDRPSPEDRLARGLPSSELARVVASLERL
jgi:hypothetical protein